MRDAITQALAVAVATAAQQGDRDAVVRLLSMAGGNTQTFADTSGGGSLWDKLKARVLGHRSPTSLARHQAEHARQRAEFDKITVDGQAVPDDLKPFYFGEPIYLASSNVHRIRYERAKNGGLSHTYVLFKNGWEYVFDAVPWATVVNEIQTDSPREGDLEMVPRRLEAVPEPLQRPEIQAGRALREGAEADGFARLRVGEEETEVGPGAGGPHGSRRWSAASRSSSATASRAYIGRAILQRQGGVGLRTMRTAGVLVTRPAVLNTTTLLEAVMSEAIPTVEYRDVQGHPGYRVGSDGSVWTLWVRRNMSGVRGGTYMEIGDAPKPLKLMLNSYGYYRVILERKTRLVHRLVLAAFVGPCPPGMEACHNDGVRTNNAVGNLRWDTRKSNHADKKIHGTSQCGENQGSHILTDAIVRTIRAEFSAGIDRPTIAKAHGLNYYTVWDVTTRKSWKHIA